MTAALPIPDRTVRFARLIDSFCYGGGTNGPLLAAMAVECDVEIADALAAVGKLADVADLHQPRTWADAITKVCAHCEKAWPCATAELVGPEP